MLTAIHGINGSKSAKYVLDRVTVTNVGGIWGLTRMKAGYSASVCRIRTGTTNAEANVLLDGNKVSLNSMVTVMVAGTSGFTVSSTMALSAFMGSQNAVCMILYNQTGSGLDLNLKNAGANYPTFATSGALITINGFPVLKGNGGHLYGSVGSRNTNLLTVVAMISKAADANYSRYVSATVGTNNDAGLNTSFSLNVSTSANTIFLERNSTVNNKTVNTGENAIISAAWDGVNQSIRKNNDTVVNTANNAQFTFDTFGILGGTYGNYYATGNIGDLVLVNGLLTNTDRQDLEREIGLKYGITVA